MKQLVRRIGRSLAFVLPVVMVTTGTLAMTRVSWTPSDSSDTQMLTASSRQGTSADATDPAGALRARLLTELQQQNPGAALNSLQQAMDQQPTLRSYCTDIAKELGQAAVRKYKGDVKRALSYARPVCDASFAAGADTSS